MLSRVVLCRRELEEAEAVSSIGVRVDHDVAGVLVVSEPLPGVVASLVAVEVLVQLLPGGTDHDQVAAPGVAGPVCPLSGPHGGVWILVPRPAQQQVVAGIVQRHAVHLVVDVAGVKTAKDP